MTDTTDELFTPDPPSITDQIACVRRELAMRANVYPKWIASGRLKAVEAERETRRMQAVHDSLVRLEALDAEIAARRAVNGPLREFVLGYALTHGGQVLMIRKTADMPSGAGLNGIGGRIHEGEEPLAAMEREWMEETGRETPIWRVAGSFGGRGFRVHVFAAGPLDSWPAWHGKGESGQGIITALLSDMLRRDPNAHYGPGMQSAMAVCPWVPMTLAMAFLETVPVPGAEPRVVVF